MSTQDRIALLQGTLDLLILRALLFRRAIRAASDDLLVDHGSLYPALQRLESNGSIRAECGVSSSNRIGAVAHPARKLLAREAGRWRRMAAAIGRVLDARKAEG